MTEDLVPEGRLLAAALTGQDLAISRRDVPGIAEELAELGWDADRIRGLREERMGSDSPWPFPVDPASVRQVGFAKFAALLIDLRTVMGLRGSHARVESPQAEPRQPDLDAKRLLADRPPHWG